jgi:hypothetical protein
MGGSCEVVCCCVFGYSVFGYSVFGYSVFGYSVFGYSVFGYSVFGYSVFGYSVFGIERFITDLTALPFSRSLRPSQIELASQADLTNWPSQCSPILAISRVKSSVLTSQR